MFDKTKVKSMNKKKLNESEYSKLDSDIEKSILESIENDNDFDFSDDDDTIEEAEGATDGDTITEDAVEDIITDPITEDLDIPTDGDSDITADVVPGSDDDLPIELPEAEENFDMEADITEEANAVDDVPAVPEEEVDFDFEDDINGENPIEEMSYDDQDPSMILDAEEAPVEAPATTDDVDFDFSIDDDMNEDAAPVSEELPIESTEEDSEEKILEDLQRIEERKMKLEAAKAELESTDKNDLIAEAKKHKAALRNLAFKYVALKEAYVKQSTKRKQLTEAAQKQIKDTADLRLENFKAVKALAIFTSSDLKAGTKMKIVEAFDKCSSEAEATKLYNTVVRKIKESAKSDDKLNQIVNSRKGTQKVVTEAVRPAKADNRSVEEMRNDYMMGIDDAYESHYYKRNSGE